MKNLIASIVALAGILVASSAAAQTPPDTFCKATQTFAASYWGEWLSLDGAGQIVQYPKKTVNVGNAFDTTNFTAPCSGVFSFTISFVRDADVHTKCTQQGTTDDVFIQVWLHPAAGGSDQLIGSHFGAWAGQTPTNVGRATGTVTVVAQLNQNDIVYTKALSDNAGPICLGEATFDASKIGR